MGGPRMTVGRILICNTCHRDWDVIELPREFIDPRLYTCPDCLGPVTGQLTMDEREVFVDERSYDPAISEMPL